jgi:hypothetical protein
MADKIDSNGTGLSIAEEATLKVLPVTPVWYPMEPNSYKDFGGQFAQVARNPINQSRQRKKGVISDLDASGGFVQDLTPNNTTRLLQGVFFADAREKDTTASLLAPAVVLLGADPVTGYTAAAGLGGFPANGILIASGFNTAANNGKKKIATVAAGAITVAEVLVVEVPPAAAKLELCGEVFALADLSIVMSGLAPRLTSAAVNMTTLGLIPGEWVFLGGDAVGSKFVNNAGFARIGSIAATYIEFDKTDWAPVNEAGAGLTIELYYGTVIKNEKLPGLIKRRTYNVERTLGSDANGVMSEYLLAAVANEMTLNIPQAEKVTIDLSFVAIDVEQRNGLTGPKAGTRPSQPTEDAYNTSSDFSRIKLASVVPGNPRPVPLFAYATDITLTVNNNVTPNKAVSVLGAFDTSTGTFEVGGKLTAYFSTIEAVQAVRNNADVTIDIIMVKANKGLLFDIPLLSLGDGRLSIEQDKPIMVPLEQMAAESSFGHTLMFQSFPYLPNAAQ